MIFTEYKEGVEYFCDYTFENTVLLHQGWARYPCKRCGNREIFDRDTITIYLYRSGFMSNYKHWCLHGETQEIIAKIRNE